MDVKQKRNWLENTILTVGIILVTATMGILVYNMAMVQDAPPDIVVSSDTIIKQASHYALHINAKNKGTNTAEDVSIEIKVGKGDDQETARLEFPYLPGKSTVDGWVTFRQDPSTDRLEFRVLGYSTP